MKSTYENTYSMYLTVEAISQRHRAVWQSHPAFAALYARWNAQVGLIRALCSKQCQTTKGLTLVKRQLRLIACTDALEVAKAVRAWAIDAGETDLAERMNYSFDSLIRGRATATAERCQTIHTEATAHLSHLADHGITAAKLAALQESITAYTTALPKPRSTISEKKRATAQLKTAFTAAQKLLRDGLDNLMPQFAKSAPDFALDYKNARKVVHVPATHKGQENQDPTLSHPTDSPATPVKSSAPPELPAPTRPTIADPANVIPSAQPSSAAHPKAA